MESFTKRPEPKSYPGILIKGTAKDVSFDYDAFMKSFVHAAASVKQTVVVEKERVNVEEFTWEKIGYIIIGEQVTKKRKLVDTCDKIEAPITDNHYFLPNRVVFIQDMQQKLAPYKRNKAVTCDSMTEEFTMLPHQKLVQSYVNIDTPYRGLLLFHGLGSGKTCSSIAIAEGLKPYKNVIVMTPASLETNFLQELKKCGSELYRLDQKWKWITDPTPEQLRERCFTEKDLRRYNSTRGIWINEGDNYEDLIAAEQESVREQIDAMIRKQYQFIHYNGINQSNFKRLVEQGNPFSNKVVIIDEAHNFVSKIVNKMGKEDHPSIQLYELLMRAENCKLVLLTGTPIINYSHEFAILFNMLRGYMTTWTCEARVDEEDMKKQIPDVDMVYKNANTVTFTQVPQGFIRGKSTDVTLTNFTASSFEERLEDYVGKKLTKSEFKAFPDTAKEFEMLYVNTAENKLKNKNKLIFRMVGLASYFPDLTELMPTLKETQMHRIPMSKTQFDEYASIRITEREREKSKSKNPKSEDEVSGTYRIFSRLICNTTYPEEVSRLRPSNKEDEILNENEEAHEVRGLNEFFAAIDASDYIAKIAEYSPKYNEMIRVIQERAGLHLIYSQFLTIEGIALFSKVLQSKGYAEFKVMKAGNGWKIDVAEKDKKKPMFLTYIGTKSQEEKELMRNIFNKNWSNVPDTLRKEAMQMSLSIFMITSAGAEGISLKQVQYVHIMEPYWNPVRIDQVIGRARRICSHNTLPPAQQFVEVHMYIMEFPKGDIPEELKRDVVGDKPGSTDEFLYSLAQRKRVLSAEITDCIKRAAVDSFLYESNYVRSMEKDPTIYSFFPDHEKDVTTDEDISKNIKLNQQRGVVKDAGKPFAHFFVAETEKDKFIPLYKLDTTEQIGYFNSGSVYTMQKVKTTISELNKR